LTDAFGRIRSVRGKAIRGKTVLGEPLNESLHDKARAAIAEFGMFEPGVGVVVAVSGGADSLALLHVLHDLAPELRLRLGVGHLHHGLRGDEADADAEFVQQAAAELSLPCVVERVDVAARARDEGIGVEHAGRRARYEFLERVARELGASRIALGHTGSDVVETVLMNLLRGAGLDGLLGIPPRRGRIVRPLIRASRRETEAFCRSRGLEPRSDRTNLDERFLRARVRCQVLPALRAEFGADMDDRILTAVELLRADAAVLDDVAKVSLAQLRVGDGPDQVQLDVSRASELAPGLLRRVIREAIRQLPTGLRDVSRAHVDAVCALIARGRTGDETRLPHGVLARRGYDVVEIGVGAAPEGGAFLEERVLDVPGEVAVPECGLLIRAAERPAPASPAGGPWEAWLDLGHCGRSLRVRPWRPGERFRPLGLDGSKKIGDFFTDTKVPRADRGRVPIVARPDGTVLWVVGHRIDHRARVTDGTQLALRLVATTCVDDATNGDAEEER
jgi:tRNA(Ile)-lysidine synthase